MDSILEFAKSNPVYKLVFLVKNNALAAYTHDKLQAALGDDAVICVGVPRLIEVVPKGRRALG